MSTIFLIIGSSGQYEDHTTWPVNWFESKHDAEKYVQLATVRGHEITDKHREAMEAWYADQDSEIEMPTPESNEYDPRYDAVDMNGYSIVEVQRGVLKEPK